MAELQCTVQKILNPDDPTVTVGERFLLTCSGVVPDFEVKTAELRLDEKEKYTLKLLRLEKKSASELQLEVLSDRVGKHELQAVPLVDATQSVVLQNLQFEVRSTQDPQNPVQEPYGSMGPLSLMVPWSYWMGLVAVISLICILIAWRLLRRSERRKQMNQILDRSSSSTPEGELFQKIRQVQRQADFLMRPEGLVPAGDAAQALGEIDRAYRVFLSRLYLIPVASWNSSVSLRAIDREQAHLSEKNRKFIAKVLRELDRAQTAELRSRDLGQLIEWIGESAGLAVKEGAKS
ncbi:MAG: hypothetical protein ACK5P7_03550 [Bdellovibrio sp.]|jgi:hypothetical protein